MYIRNLRAFSDSYKHGDIYYAGGTTFNFCSTDLQADDPDFVLNSLGNQLRSATEIVIINEAVDDDCHVGSHFSPYLPAVISSAQGAKVLIVRGYSLTFPLPLAKSRLTTVSLCNVHFGGHMDVISFLSSIVSLRAVYLHYVTCASDVPDGVALPSSIRDVMLTSDHSTPAMKNPGLRFQDHFLRWATTHPGQLPAIDTFAVWEVEDCTADLVVDFLDVLARSHVPIWQVHITIRNGHHYARSALGDLHRQLQTTEERIVEWESDVDFSLPALLQH